MLRVGIVAAVVVALSAPAQADDAARIKQARAMFDAQVAAMRARDDAAFAKTLAGDARVAWAIYNTADVPSDAQHDFLLIKRVEVVATQIGWDGTWGWLTAELRVRWQMYAEPEGAGDPNPQPVDERVRWVAVIVPDGDVMKTEAALVASAHPDSKLEPISRADDARPVAAAGPLARLLEAPSTVHVASDPATAIFGTAETEHALGATAARRQLAAWKRLALSLVVSPCCAGGPDTVEVVRKDHGFAFGRLALKLRGKAEPVELTGFVVAKKVGDDWQVVALAYSGGRS